jgi:hypothetical protein
MTQFDDGRRVWTILRGHGVSEGVCAGILGNMQAESGIIPDRDEIGGGGGYGLVQWTPKSKLTSWAAQNGLDHTSIDTQCARIIWEADHAQQFYMPGWTFHSWLASDRSPEQAADDFVRFYERPAVINSSVRQRFARAWYNQLAGIDLTRPTGSDTDLAIRVLDGAYGDGDTRRTNLGDRYDQVQTIVNHWCELAARVWAGDYGDGNQRVAALGPDYDGVQHAVNLGIGQATPPTTTPTYTVQSGDNLSSIAAHYGTTWQTLAAINGLTNPDLIHPGDILRIG